MENRNYEELMPLPPKDLAEWALEQKLFEHTDRMIFSAEWVYNPLLEIKERMAKCVCTNCHETFYEGWNPVQGGCVSYYGSRYAIHTQTKTIPDGDSWVCPCCGAQVKLTHISHIDPYSFYNIYRIVSTFEKIEDKLVLAEYMIVKQIFKDGTVNYEVKPWEAYIYENKKCITLRGWWSNIGQIKFYSHWHQMSRYLEPKEGGTWLYIYPHKKDFTVGTTMENSKLEQYLTTQKSLYPVQYLRFYQRKSKLETIMSLNLTNFVAKEIEECSTSPYGTKTPFPSLNWKEKSPYKILGLDRAEIKLLKKYNWDSNWLELFKNLRNSGIKLTPENISFLMQFGFHIVLEIYNSKEPILKTLKYLCKQSSNPKRIERFSFLTDYWQMAKKLGYNLENPVIKYPKNLKESHNKAVEAVNWATQKALVEKFENLYINLSKLSFNNGEFCIRPAMNEKELIVEGKILKHCVGGYGKTHCDGKSIFFVRKSTTPQEPWFTLNVELSTGRKIQLHGYDNERSGQVIPKEVNQFVDYWLKNIFRKFSIEKMEFTEKPKKNKKAAVTAA